MCIWKILSIKKLLWLLANITIGLTLVKGRPQDILVESAKSALMAFQQGAEIVGNGGLISKNHDLELPFAKASSKSEIGSGQAMMRRDNSESSEEDENDRIRRKRSMHDIAGEESLLASPSHYLQHHIFKRASCHGTGGTTTGTGTDGGEDVIDFAERRRRARKAAAAKKKKAKNSARKTKKSKIVNDDNEETLTRHKRQSEQDDLNANANDAGKDIAQHAQQFAEKIRNVWEGFINSINQMAEGIRQKFAGNNPSATENI